MSEVAVIASTSPDAVREIARRLAAQHTRIAVLAAARQPLQVLASELVAAGAPSVLGLPCDVLAPGEVDACARRIEEELGPIDRWINTSMPDFGYVCGTRTALACMRERSRGTIVQVSPPAAVRHFTEGVRSELRVSGSRIAVECVRTYPYRRAGAALFAAASVVGGVLLRRVIRVR